METICAFTAEITQFLLTQGVKLLIIACNTMAAVARHIVEELSPVAVLDVIDAGARCAVSVTRVRYVRVIGTPATINSNAYARSIHRYDPSVRIFSQACLFLCLWWKKDGWIIRSRASRRRNTSNPCSASPSIRWS
nr:aspartate/glutamate racemase family protein [Desulfosoma caldarium]